MDEPPAKKLRTGGLQQRLRKQELAQAPLVKDSKLADILLEKWAWGEISPQMAQELAAASLRDFAAVGATPPEALSALGKLGSHGMYDNKMHKEILQIANQSCRFSSVSITPLPFKPPWHKQLQSLLLPHVVFADIFHRYPLAFRKFLVPNTTVLQEFWSLQRGHPAFAGHPVVDQPSFQPAKTVPLSCHGDGTPVVGIGKIWSRMLTSWSWSSLVCPAGWTKDAQLPIWFLFDETASTDTMDGFWQLLSWSFKSLQEGTWPSADHLGRKILATHTYPFFFLKLRVGVCGGIM